MLKDIHKLLQPALFVQSLLALLFEREVHAALFLRSAALDSARHNQTLLGTRHSYVKLTHVFLTLAPLVELLDIIKDSRIHQRAVSQRCLDAQAKLPVIFNHARVALSLAVKLRQEHCIELQALGFMNRHNLHCLLGVQIRRRRLRVGLTHGLHLRQPVAKARLTACAEGCRLVTQLAGIRQLAFAVLLHAQHSLHRQHTPQLGQKLRQSVQRCVAAQLRQKLTRSLHACSLLRREARCICLHKRLPQAFRTAQKQLRQRRVVQPEVRRAQNAGQLQTAVAVMQHCQEVQQIQHLLPLVEALAVDDDIGNIFIFQLCGNHSAFRHGLQQHGHLAIGHLLVIVQLTHFLRHCRGLQPAALRLLLLRIANLQQHRLNNNVLIIIERLEINIAARILA